MRLQGRDRLVGGDRHQPLQQRAERGLLAVRERLLLGRHRILGARLDRILADRVGDVVVRRDRRVRASPLPPSAPRRWQQSSAFIASLGPLIAAPALPARWTTARWPGCSRAAKSGTTRRISRASYGAKVGSGQSLGPSCVSQSRGSDADAPAGDQHGQSPKPPVPHPRRNPLRRNRRTGQLPDQRPVHLP